MRRPEGRQRRFHARLLTATRQVGADIGGDKLVPQLDSQNDARRYALLTAASRPCLMWTVRAKVSDAPSLR